MKFFCCSFIKVRTIAEIIRDVTLITQQTKQYDREEDMMVFLLVPTPALAAVSEAADHRYVKIGAQNINPLRLGQVSGGLSIEMLRLLGADMAMAGASDRRVHCNESDALAGEKLTDILKSGLKSLLGVGETSAQKNLGEADGVLRRQILLGCREIPPNAFYRLGIVYQPLWSAAETDGAYIRGKSALIRKTLKDVVPRSPEPLPVFYGGPMREQDASMYLTSGLFDGIFVDNTSLCAEQFIRVIKAVCGD